MHTESSPGVQRRMRMRGETRGGDRPTRPCGRTRGIQRKFSLENIPNFCAWTENNRNAYLRLDARHVRKGAWHGMHQ
eukprot:5549109-Prymnesium_polylepis.1